MNRFRALSLTFAGLLAMASAACEGAAAPAIDDESETTSTVMTVPEESETDIARRAVSFPSRRKKPTAAPVPTTEPAPAPAPAPDAVPAPVPARPVAYRGVNLAGAEFGSALPGTEGTDYRFPTEEEVDYFLAKGMTTFRIGFKWERLQKATYAAFEATYASRLDAIVARATAKGASVILNPHNFARYRGELVGSSAVPNAAFADFWKKLASRYAANGRVLFNLVNEPNTMPTEQWVSAANAAIAAIRSAGAHGTIIVPGNAWTGGHSWYQTWYGTSNAVAMLAITDPEDNVWFEAHQYLDTNAGGTEQTCVSTTAGRERLAPFIGWLRANGKKGFIGELAGGNNATCRAAITDMLAYMNAQEDVLMGWLWWAAGPAWGDYAFSIEPTRTASGLVDRPYMAWLTPYL